MNEQANAHHQRCIQNIQAFQKLIDQVLPQAGKLVLDIGLLNDTLCEASALMREAKDGAE